MNSEEAPFKYERDFDATKIKTKVIDHFFINKEGKSDKRTFKANFFNDEGSVEELAYVMFTFLQLMESYEVEPEYYLTHFHKCLDMQTAEIASDLRKADSKIYKKAVKTVAKQRIAAKAVDSSLSEGQLAEKYPEPTPRYPKSRAGLKALVIDIIANEMYTEEDALDQQIDYLKRLKKPTKQEVKKHTMRFKTLIEYCQLLRGNRGQPDRMEQIKMFLRTFPTSWIARFKQIYGANNDSISYRQVQDFMTQEKKQRDTTAKKNNNNGANNNGANNSGGRRKGGKNKRNRNNDNEGKFKKKSRRGDKDRKICNFCTRTRGKGTWYGHTEDECWFKKQQEQKNNKSPKLSAAQNSAFHAHMQQSMQQAAAQWQRDNNPQHEEMRSTFFMRQDGTFGYE